MTRSLPIAALLAACADAPTPAPVALGPSTAPLPGDGVQGFAALACRDADCVVARKRRPTVLFSALDPTGAPRTQHPPPDGASGWNHPVVVPWGDGFLAVVATHGAPMAVHLDGLAAPTSGPQPLTDPWPWGEWPDAALLDDGRVHAVWSTRVAAHWRVFDPAAFRPGGATSWEARLAQGTVDPPAVVAVPGGAVRAWTEKNGFDWEVWLQWTDLDGLPDGDPVLVHAAEGRSRGARPQLAADDDGAVAVVWRDLPDLGEDPRGAYLRLYDPDGAPRTDPIRLDGDLGDRPEVAALPGGWLVSWEEGAPEAVWIRAFAPDGQPEGPPLPVSDAEVECGRSALAVWPDGDGWRGLVAWEEVAARSPTNDLLDALVRLRPIRGR